MTSNKPYRPTAQVGLAIMQVITHDTLKLFSSLLQSSSFSEEAVKNLFEICSEKIFHGWAKRDVVAEMCRIFKGEVDEDIVLLIELSDDLDLDLVLEKVGKADPDSGIGSWTIEWAIDEIYGLDVCGIIRKCIDAKN